MVTLDLSFSSCSIAVRYFFPQYLSKHDGRHQTAILVRVVEEILIRTHFKGDNVKAFVKTSNCENLVLFFSKKIQQITPFFLFSVTIHSLENEF